MAFLLRENQRHETDVQSDGVQHFTGPYGVWRTKT